MVYELFTQACLLPLLDDLAIFPVFISLRTWVLLKAEPEARMWVHRERI